MSVPDGTDTEPPFRIMRGMMQAGNLLRTPSARYEQAAEAAKRTAEARAATLTATAFFLPDDDPTILEALAGKQKPAAEVGR